MVTGNGSGNFRDQTASLGAADVRIIATPIGGSGRATTGSLAVSPGSDDRFPDRARCSRTARVIIR